jgi:hypothetical protein
LSDDAAEQAGRMAELERRIASLEARLARLDGPREASPRAPAPAAPPAPAPSAASMLPWPLAKDVDFESLIGRYGTLVLATISALAAVGLFLGWAIDKGLLGPSQRIALGLLAAAGLAVGGLRLRRTERSFGASLLGLSLAIVHVCAWGAGPSLGLVDSWVAFAAAAAASIALAVFAHVEDDEPLWSVGFSGAAVAPFVTASGKSDLVLLAAYGAAVLASAGYAMGARRWIVAGRLFLVAAAAYTLALATGFERQGGPLLALAFPLVVALTAVIPWIGGWERRDRLRAMGALAAMAALRSGFGMDMPFGRSAVAMLIAAAGIVWLAIVDGTHAVRATDTDAPTRRLHEGDWLDAAVLPLAFALASLTALDAGAGRTGQVMAAASAVLFVTVLRNPRGTLRDASVFATVLCALVAAILLLRGEPLVFTSAVAAMSALCFLANRAWPSVSWTTMGLTGFAWCVLASVAQLTGREAYAYRPFGTAESGVAASIALAIAIAWWLTEDTQPRRVLAGGGVVWMFAWVHQELAFAFNPTVSTLLLVTYYAASSVVAVGVGRARRIALLRHAGLGLAIVAAGTALYGARHLNAIGARIAADLVAAVFLLAIAYWYRRPGGSASSRVPGTTATHPNSVA